MVNFYSRGGDRAVWSTSPEHRGGDVSCVQVSGHATFHKTLIWHDSSSRNHRATTDQIRGLLKRYGNPRIRAT